MRNIFLFIRRYFTFLSFLLLQAVSLWMLVSYNKFHQAKGMGMANAITGRLNEKYNFAEDFFHLKSENIRLLKMNDSLLNMRKDNFIPTLSGTSNTQEVVTIDSVKQTRQYSWYPAQVIYNTVNDEKNYLQINRGSEQGVKDNMGVFSSNGGLVGTVVNVGSKYSTVMSLLHVQSKINVLIKKSQTTGTLSWDGKNPRLLTMTNVPKNDSMRVGDTILTGNYSLSFPPGKMVGRVAKILKDKSSTFLVLKIKPTAPFSVLQQVELVDNLSYTIQNKQLEETRKNVEATKKN